MLKTIMTPTKTHIEFDIPSEYVGKKVEISCILLAEEVDPKKSKMADFWGILSNETAAEIYKSVEKSREEWDRSI